MWQLRFKVMTTDFFLRNLSIIIFVRLAWTTPQNTIFEKKMVRINLKDCERYNAFLKRFFLGVDEKFFI